MKEKPRSTARLKPKVQQLLSFLHPCLSSHRSVFINSSVQLGLTVQSDRQFSPIQVRRHGSPSTANCTALDPTAISLSGLSRSKELLLPLWKTTSQQSFATPVALVALPVSGVLLLTILMSLTILRNVQKTQQQDMNVIQSKSGKNETNLRRPPEIGLFELWLWGKRTPGFAKNRIAVLTTIEKHYGQLFTLRFGPFMKITIASGSDAVRQTLRARENVLAFETILQSADRINHVVEENTVALATSSYRRRVELTGKIGTDFGKASRIMNACEEPIVREVRSELQRWANESRQKGSVDLHKSMSRAIIRITLRVFLGHEFVERHGDEFWQAFSKWEVEAYGLPWLLIPRLARRLNGKIGKNFSHFTKILRSWIEDFDQGKRQMPPDSYVRVLWERADPEMRLALTGHMIAILVGVHINTASSGAWTIAETLHHPEVTVRARREASSYSFKDWSNPKAMSSMTNVFHEVLRYYFNSVSMREVRSPFTYKDMEVPGDRRRLLLSTMSSHRDPSYYKDPNSFIPDRFQDPAFLAQSADTKKLMLWGGGPHTCPGRFMATCILRTLWSELLQTYDVSLADGNLPEQHFGSVGTASPVSPIFIRVLEKSEGR